MENSRAKLAGLEKAAGQERINTCTKLGRAALALAGAGIVFGGIGIGGIVGTEFTPHTTKIDGIEFTTSLSFDTSEYGKVFERTPLGNLEIDSKSPYAPGIEVNAAFTDQGVAQLDQWIHRIQDTHVRQEAFNSIVDDQKWNLVGRFSLGAAAAGLIMGGLYQAGKLRGNGSFKQARSWEKARVAGTSTARAAITSATSAAVGLAQMGGVGVVYGNTADHVQGTGVVASIIGTQHTLRGIDSIQTQELMPYLKGWLSLGELARTKLSSPEKEASTAINLLFVSDIHGRNRYPLMQDIVKDQHINAVIDTGDLINFGFPQELALTKLANGVKSLHVPYLYVTGNHDSQGSNDFSVINALKKSAPNVIPLQPNATTYNEVSIGGYTIAGMDDRGHYYTDSIDNETAALQTPYVTLFDHAFQDTPLDLAVAHEPYATSQMDVGILTANGHTHKAALVGNNINPGTFTGGDELRSAGSYIDALAQFTTCKDTTKGTDGCTPPSERPSSYAILSIGEDCRPNTLTIYQYIIQNGHVANTVVTAYNLSDVAKPSTNRNCDMTQGVSVQVRH